MFFEILVMYENACCQSLEAPLLLNTNTACNELLRVCDKTLVLQLNGVEAPHRAEVLGIPDELPHSV